MFTLSGRSVRHCDGISRRGFLSAGAMGLGGLTLADLLRAENAAGVGSSHKAIINIHLDGGPPQMDTIDMKPHAPSEIRGEFLPIQTSLPGFQICELFPKMAAVADRFSYIRSLVGSAGRHDAFQCQSGYGTSELKGAGRPTGDRLRDQPSCSSSTDDTSPAFVDLMQGRPLVRNSGSTRFPGSRPTDPSDPISRKIFARELETGMKGELVTARFQPHHQPGAQPRHPPGPNPVRDAQLLDRTRSHPTRSRRQRHDGRHGPLHSTGRRHPHLRTLRPGSRLHQRTPRSARPLHQAPPDSIERFATSESPDGSIETTARSTADRSRSPSGQPDDQ